MSIASKIQDIDNIKLDLKSCIENAGFLAPICFTNYPAIIENILYYKQGQNVFVVEVDSSTDLEFGFAYVQFKDGTEIANHIDWGDGTVEAASNVAYGNTHTYLYHTYVSPGRYVVKVSANVYRIAVNNSGGDKYVNCVKYVCLDGQYLEQFSENGINGSTTAKSILLTKYVAGGSGMLKNCTGLEYAYCNCSLAVEMFRGATNIVFAAIPNVNSIDNNAFNVCIKLRVIDFSDRTSDEIPTVTEKAFQHAVSNFNIVVPDRLYDAWIASPVWSNEEIVEHIIKTSEYNK